jgi:hypothetical protein
LDITTSLYQLGDFKYLAVFKPGIEWKMEVEENFVGVSCSIVGDGGKSGAAPLPLGVLVDYSYLERRYNHCGASFEKDQRNCDQLASCMDAVLQYVQKK